ncbi:MAG TPA: MurR/RpiR family transcriptional regulator [Geminicoccaceae bacterium]|nr:MurR/RpiR family transcriptional regulator [Geminicoccus sp.]HMU52637.1 MurR/RpiR family transcriptional regulator [Geminicoccaceae bacterium]
MRLIERVESCSGELTEADHRLLAVLLGDVVGVGALSAREIASRAGVHETTAGRLASKLGFRTYRELRRELIQELDLAVRMSDRLHRIGSGSVLEAVVASEIKVISAIPQQVAQEQIDEAVGLLLAARRILVFGTSHAGVLATLLARRLVRSGYDARPLHHVDWQAADALLGIGAGDVLVVFQFWRATESLSRLAAAFKSSGGGIVLISDGPGRLVEPRPDVTLAALRGGLGESQSLAAPMIIANTLVLELSRADGGKSLDSLRRLGELRDRVDSRPRGDRAAGSSLSVPGVNPVRS